MIVSHFTVDSAASVKILILYFLYSFAAALLQPLGDSRMISLLEQAAGSFMLAFAVVALTGVLFFHDFNCTGSQRRDAVGHGSE